VALMALLACRRVVTDGAADRSRPAPAALAVAGLAILFVALVRVRPAYDAYGWLSGVPPRRPSG
jgi:hypothetical protein